MINPSTAGVVDAGCATGRVAMTRGEAARRAGWWRRLLRIPTDPYRCPLCGYHHIARAVR